LVPRILRALRESGVSNVPVVVGGIIPPSDALELKRIGVSQVFGPGCSTSEMIATLRRLVSKHEEAAV
jgi:methylmalonyl-CoA mutase C-terminal domain/subunit